MNRFRGLGAIGAIAMLIVSTIVASPANAEELNVPEKLAKSGGTVEMVVAGQSKSFEISPRNFDSQKTAVPYCSYKAKSGTIVRTYSRAGVSGFGGSKAYLKCGKYDNEKTKRDGWGLRHIGDGHKKAWESKAGGSDWFEMMQFATKSTLKNPETGIRQPSDNYLYCAPVELKYNGKVYDRFKTKVPVRHKGQILMSSYPGEKC
ncbi:hypothetical protein [Brevibacterium spongiae]|uniref:Uncharacterized protein n=1 Tax=Brevibacterium spongiae TaxID=2909672 RepID=A0ABY5SK00_9MICO|nr:hypothetical protein [Brevibacterium spongiae]UVI34600.1 hypothetical protein L1F31_10675 [Brevibacterium spongiae]